MISSSASPARASRPARRSRLLRWALGPTFARDVAVVVAVKLVLLAALKFAFFDHPQAPHMSMRPSEVARALLAVSAPKPR